MCQAGASIAACRSSPPAKCASRKHSCHWSCWSPPGVPQAITGSPSRTTSVGDSVVRGRRDGRSVDGSPSSSQVICPRVPRQKPSSGMVGALCSQPPDGVAETIVPHRSTTSTWQVSPRSGSARVGSPVPAAEKSANAVRYGGMTGVRPPGEPGRSSPTASAPINARRSPRVRRREQVGQRHVRVVAVEGLPVGERELGALDHPVDQLGAAGRRQVAVAEQGQLLQQHRPLAPGRRLGHGQPAPVEGDRRLPARPPAGQVVAGEQAGVRAAGVVHPRLGGERVDRLRDEPLVPGPARGLQLSLPVGAGRLSLGQQPPVRLGQRRLAQPLARRRCRQPAVGRGRPVVPEQRLAVRDRARHPRVHRVPVGRVADRVRQHVAQRQPAVRPQQLDPGPERAGHGGGQRPGAGHERQPELVAEPGRRSRRPAACPARRAPSGRGRRPCRRSAACRRRDRSGAARPRAARTRRPRRRRRRCRPIRVPPYRPRWPTSGLSQPSRTSRRGPVES